jgi:hypothetical protein
MNEPDCPYLIRETIAYRESLDLSRRAPTRVTVSWQCSHPFHGIRLEIGDARDHVADHCSACTLPRSGERQRRDEPQRRQPDAGGERTG